MHLKWVHCMVGAFVSIECDVTLWCWYVGKLSPCRIQVRMGHNYICWWDNSFCHFWTVVARNIYSFSIICYPWYVAFFFGWFVNDGVGSGYMLCPDPPICQALSVSCSVFCWCCSFFRLAIRSYRPTMSSLSCAVYTFAFLFFSFCVLFLDWSHWKMLTRSCFCVGSSLSIYDIALIS